jgi:hypothetical protein
MFADEEAAVAEDVEQIRATLAKADPASVKFVCLSYPEPVADSTDNQPRTEESGELLYRIDLLVVSDGPAMVFCVEFPGTPTPGLLPARPVKLTGLNLSDWAVTERHDITFRVAKVQPAHEQTGGAA